jgi:hypothetical protein
MLFYLDNALITGAIYYGGFLSGVYGDGAF